MNGLYSGYLVISAAVCLTAAFKAAVYEHNVIFPSPHSQVPRDVALYFMRKNIDVYKIQSTQAAEQGAQIIVFPEYGLYGLGWTRRTIEPYLEFIPDPEEVSWNPCVDPTRYNNTEVQHQLSCIAKNASIYIVVNFGARQPCNSSEPNCPLDGRFQFSTNLVYDSQGKFIARYFKQNLFSDETYFNRPEKTNYTTFSTPFGRFGTFASYDTMFQDPAITLIKTMNITNIVYPTAWKDELPLLAAIEFHSAFSEGMHINLMAANLHLPTEGYHGSGIYWPVGTSNDGVYFYNRTLNSTGKLLVQELSPVEPPPEILPSPGLKRREAATKPYKAAMKEKNSPGKRLVQELSQVGSPPEILANPGLKNPEAETKSYKEAMKDINTVDESVVGDIPMDNDEFIALMNHDLYTFVPIRSSYGDIKVCQGTLCCHASFEGMFNNTLLALGAFDGLHSYNGEYYLQACAFIACANRSVLSCGQPTNTTSGYMSKMSFVGNFTASYVLPEVLVYYEKDALDIVSRTWLYQDSIIIDVGVPGSPISISMYAIGKPTN